MKYKYVIQESYKTIDRHNPISGHSWTELKEKIGYIVIGGLWLTTKHKTYNSALKEVETRKNIDELINKH